jgi:hypothetical protein
MDDGFGTEFTQVSTYTDNSMTHTVSSGLTAGRIHTFKYRCKNDVGDSDFSIMKRFAASAPPVKPAAPTKDMAKSTLTSIYVEWAESEPSAVPILGYKLYMSEGTEEYATIFSEA